MVENSDAFQRVTRAVETLSMVGTQVVYYHVRREYNVMADNLASRASGRRSSVDFPAKAQRTFAPMFRDIGSTLIQLVKPGDSAWKSIQTFPRVVALAMTV